MNHNYSSKLEAFFIPLIWCNVHKTYNKHLLLTIIIRIRKKEKTFPSIPKKVGVLVAIPFYYNKKKRKKISKIFVFCLILLYSFPFFLSTLGRIFLTICYNNSILYSLLNTHSNRFNVQRYQCIKKFFFMWRGIGGGFILYNKCIQDLFNF